MEFFILFFILLPAFSGFLSLVFRVKNAAFIGGLVSVTAGFINALVFSYAYHFQNQRFTASVEWFSVGENIFWLHFHYGQIAAVMMPILFLLTLAVIIYSKFYFSKDSDLKRFLGQLCLFVAGMSGLLTADTWFQFLSFWEFIGIISFLLVAFERGEKKSADSALKVLFINKIGDVGLWILVLWFSVENPNRLSEISSGVPSWVLYAGIFAAMSKSAQFPFSLCVLSAMTAPTPASALLHAATLVTAGIILLFHLSPAFDAETLQILTWVGLLTSIFGGISALQSGNLKKILASSTVSQLGLMFFSLGTGNRNLALLFLAAHAFYKAGLFLSAGILSKGNFSENSLDTNGMGGLWEKSPFFSLSMGILFAAMCGLPLFSGFFVKEHLLHYLFEAENRIFLFGLLTAFFLTSGYSAYTWLRICFGAKEVFSFSGKHRAMQAATLITVFCSFWFLFGDNPLGDNYEFWQQEPVRGSLLLVFLGLFVNILGYIFAYNLFRKKLSGADSEGILFLPEASLNVLSLAIFRFFAKERESQGDFFPIRRENAFAGLILLFSNKIAFADKFWANSKDVFVEIVFIFAFILSKFDDFFIDGIVRLIYGSFRKMNILLKRWQGKTIFSYILLLLSVIAGLFMLFFIYPLFK